MTLTFANLPHRSLHDLADVTAAILGVSEASPYKPGRPSNSAAAPGALRLAAASFAGQLTQLDFDLGCPLLPAAGLVDCGDVPTDPADAAGNRRMIETAVRQLLEAGVVPVVLGGDDSVPIPVFAAYEGRGPFTVLQIDAHVDWGDVIQDNPFGYGSPMRRAAEMGWIDKMVQIGIRGLGSGASWQINDAREWGSQLVESRRFHQDAQAAIDLIAPGAQVLVTIDCDGLDPAVLPAVNMPTPGGLTYEDVITILHGVHARAAIAGFVLTELVPERDDAYRLSALTAARIVSVALGLIAQGAEKKKSMPGQGNS
jgi:agmatinase